MDIVEQMRSFESDHEPDGWPAIQMKQVSALCDEIERLRSIINAANAQEPVDYERLLNGEWVKCSKTRYEVTSDPVRALYARPIPAQQSQVSGEYESALKDLQEYLGYESISAEDRKMLSRVINVMESVQQSPAVAVPEKNLYSTDQYLEVDKSKVPVAYYLPAVPMYHERVTLDEKTARHWSSHMGAKIVELVPYQSPRITEQDAREMALSAWRYWMNNCDRTVDNWIEDEGLDLINKLNEAKHD